MRAVGVLAALAMTVSVSGMAVNPVTTAQEELPVVAEPEEPVFVKVGDYHEGRVFVTDGTLWGYAGVEGGIVIEPKFDQVEEFFLGCAKVTREGKVGLLRWDGSWMIRPDYDELTAVDYGVYLGRRGELWDLLSVTKITSLDGTTQALYSDLVYAAVYEGVMGRVVVQNQEKEWTSILISALPQTLEQKRVPGWQFPLSGSRRADFADVQEDDWFTRWINLAYSVGMMEGTGDGMFEPMRFLTVAETLRLAACLESRARQDDFHLQEQGTPWYQSSVVYCEAVGIIKTGQFSHEDYGRPITRAEMAQIFATTASVRGIRDINELAAIKNTVPDVVPADPAAEAIYQMYAKGILNGTDSQHSFHPDGELTRAEVSAIITRIARPEQRISFW